MGLLDKIRNGLESNEDVGFIREKNMISCIKDSTPWQAIAFYVSPKNEEKDTKESFYSVRHDGYWASVGGGAGRVGTTVWEQPHSEVHSGGYYTVFKKPLDKHLNKFMRSMLEGIGKKPTIATECSIRPTSRGGYITIGGYYFRESIATEQIVRRVQITDSDVLSALDDGSLHWTQDSENTIEDITKVTHYRSIFVFPMPSKKFADGVAKDPLSYRGILYNPEDYSFREGTKKERIMNGIENMIDNKCIGRRYSFPDHIHHGA